MSRLLILGRHGTAWPSRAQPGRRRAGTRSRCWSGRPPSCRRSLRERVSVHTGDLSALVPLDLVRGQDALINCAGHVADGETFVGLVDRLAIGVGILDREEQPVCWFLAGAALLDIGASGRRGCRSADPEVKLLAAPRELRAVDAIKPGLAAAVSRAAGRCAGDRIGPAAHLAGRPAREGAGSRRCAAGDVVAAGLHVRDSATDGALRRCGGRHARQSRSRKRDVAPSRWPGTAGDGKMLF